MKHWFQNIREGCTFQGLEVFEVDNTAFFSLLNVKRTKSELVTVYEGLFENLEELVSYVNKKQPLLLTINTAKVLKKQIPLDIKGTPEQWVSIAFPNLSLENFYYEVLDSKELRVVSLSKKEHIVHFLETLQSHGIIPCSVSLGVSGIGNCLSYFTETTVRGSNFELSKHGGSEVAMDVINSTRKARLELNGLTLSNISLLSFSNILGHLGKVPKASNLLSFNEELGNNFQNSRLFDVSVKWGLGIFLAILLSNFLLFSHYHNKTMGMETLASIEQQNNTLKILKSKVVEKENRLKTLLGSASSSSTYYLDQIAKELPNSILLENMDYQPLSKPVRDNNVIEVLEHVIMVAGNSNDKTEFSQWTESLETKSWVDKVEIIGYEYVTKSMDSFTLKITSNEVEQ
ncbi:hypothetical protein [Muricauda sp. MAR_2010_75]|uniref:hypothetical protein n=1 Tax=Allomuricauda sp. MAR_2010_75 TaxID=1250232 RepID=UPI00055FDCCD|nr:hypothetical protein [Muricauda sp. MAR_2010_75]